MASERGKFWIVTVTEQAYVSDKETKESADSDCAARNARAEELGMVTRYIVVEK